jgi:hypothetical protein
MSRHPRLPLRFSRAPPYRRTSLSCASQMADSFQPTLTGLARPASNRRA